MFPKDILKSISHQPGVYLMKDDQNRVIYVGKAKDLYKRLSSYARHNLVEHNKTAVMLRRVATVDTIITITEKEALILEASLIKRHKPRYNIILRDDKNYPYIAVTIHEEWPRVMMVRHKKKDKARYFGPYSSSTAMWATLKLIASLFPLRSCKGAKLQKRERACLNHQIGRCLAPCVGAVSHTRYMENVNNIIMLLEGKNKKLLHSLQSQMQEAAKALAFEQAAKLRDQIAALKTTLERQIIAAKHNKAQDIFGFCRFGTSVAISILFVRDGLISGTRTFLLEDYFGLDAPVLSQAMSQFYDGSPPLPKEILLPFPPENLPLIDEWLSNLRKGALYIKLPQRGESMQLLEMAESNAKKIFEEREKKEQSWKSLCKNIQIKLKLMRPPETIECLDISNISGQHAIGSLVCFTAGEKNTSRFRHYKIKTIEGPNDYGMMREVLERRFRRALEEDNFPDLFVVDGGKGQLKMALDVAQQLGVTDRLDWLGIAKERQEEGEKLYKPGRKNPIILAEHSPILLYLMRIRDESHRYGITFHRKLRNKATLSSELDSIDGVGVDRKKQLLKELGSLKNILAADIDQLQKVPGIGQKLAKKIYDNLHPKK